MSFWETINSRRNSGLIVVAVGVLFIGIILYNSFSGNTGVYESRVTEFRETRDLWLRNSPESPIPREAKPDFDGLAYFPVDPAFMCAADLERDPTPDTIRMLLTNGEFDEMVQVGTLEFTLKDRPQSLVAFRSVKAGAGSDLFVPFTDLTSGTLSYGGGRYLNVPVKGGITVDFNYAYHPDCLHNDRAACPIPPAENRIELEVTAGEKLPEGNSGH